MFKFFTLTRSVGNEPVTQVAMLPDRPLLVSMSGRKVEFSGFPYLTQHSSTPGPAPPLQHMHTVWIVTLQGQDYMYLNGIVTPPDDPLHRCVGSMRRRGVAARSAGFGAPIDYLSSTQWRGL